MRASNNPVCSLLSALILWVFYIWGSARNAKKHKTNNDKGTTEYEISAGSSDEYVNVSRHMFTTSNGTSTCTLRVCLCVQATITIPLIHTSQHISQWHFCVSLCVYVCQRCLLLQLSGVMIKFVNKFFFVDFVAHNPLCILLKLLLICTQRKEINTRTSNKYRVVVYPAKNNSVGYTTTRILV